MNSPWNIFKKARKWTSTKDMFQEFKLFSVDTMHQISIHEFF